jgi:hypothetical protein
VPQGDLLETEGSDDEDSAEDESPAEEEFQAPAAGEGAAEPLVLRLTVRRQ